MFPPIFVVDHRVVPAPFPADPRHKDRPHVRRGQPERLDLRVDPHAAPHGPADAPIPDVPMAQHRALLIELASDPRFARDARPATRPGLRVRLGQALMRLGWRLVRGPRGEPRQAG